MKLFPKKQKNVTNNLEKNENYSEKQEKITKSRKKNREALRKKRTIQNALYYDMMMKGGICATRELDGYNSAFRFTDINYQVATEEDQTKIFSQYMELLNALGNENNLQLLVHNRLIDEEDFENRVLLRDQNDDLQPYRREYNNMLKEKVRGGNNRIVTEKYMIYNIKEDSYERALRSINQYDSEYRKKFSNLGCKTEKLDGYKRLELMHNIMYPEKKFFFNYDNLGGYDTTKDCIAPMQLDFEPDHFILDGRYCRVLYLKDYSTELSDEMINQLTKLEHNLTISFNMRAIPRGEDIVLIKNKIAMMEMEIVEKQKKASQMGYDPQFSLPMDLRTAFEEAEEEARNVEQRNQRMFECQFFVMINAKSKEEMEQITNSVQVIAKNRTTQMEILRMHQEEGFNCCLPLGYRDPFINRTLETPQCAIMMPFTSQELMDEGDSNYYGVNSVTKNLIMCNRKNLKNPSAWIFAVPGGGKSFAAKREMVSVRLRENGDDLIIIDPENEYHYLAEMFNGSVIPVNNKSNVHINALDGDIDRQGFVASKADFCQIFTAQVMGRDLEAGEKSIIDRCVRQMYSKYRQQLDDKYGFKKSEPPTLKTLWEELKLQPESTASDLATAIEMYVTGSYDLFSGQSTVDIRNRMTVYNILETEETIKPVAMLVILESLWEKIIDNFRDGKRTWVWIDEIYLLFQDEYCAKFLYELFKRARKYGAIITGITQNVEDLLNSPTARTMLSNSEFIYMLAQSENDKLLLGELLHLSEEQMSYLSNAERGSGLLYNGNNIVIPFEDSFPKNTRLYEAMTTDFEERQRINEGRRLQ